MIKYFLIGLLFLLSISLIFTNPGINEFEVFYKYQSSAKFNQIAGLVRFTPGTYAVFDIISRISPPHITTQFFYTSTAWGISKFILFFSYIFTWLALLYLVKSNKNIFKVSLLDSSLAYFSSVSFLLFISIGYFEFLAAPFFIIALSLLLRKNAWSVFFYILAVLFNWTLLVFAPLFYLTSVKFQNRSFLYTVMYKVGFIIAPAALSLFIFYSDYNLKTSSGLSSFSSVLFNFPFLAKHTLDLAKELRISNNLNFLDFSIGNYTLTFLALFGFLYIKLLLQFRKIKQLNFPKLFEACLCVLLAFLLFSSYQSEGNLIWFVLLSIIIYLFHPLEEVRLKLFAANILVFINLFSMHGLAKYVPVSGLFFQYCQLIFAAIFVFFACWYIKKGFTANFLINSNKWLVKFLIVYLILVNISLIPATGTGDSVSYRDTARFNVEFLNPFKAKAVDPEMYPPLHTVIIGIFANLWHFIAKNNNYIYPVKSSIIFFYFLTVFIFLKFNKIMGIKNNLGLITKGLVVLSTFSIIIQAQGLSDVNIHTIPTLVLAIILLFKNKIFWGGLVFGVTILIKPQPLLLLPLFGITLINFQQNWQYSVKRLFSFCLGILLINALIWLPVLMHPEGIASFQRTMTYILRLENFGALSGQALNLNWIITYILHLTGSGVSYIQESGGISGHVSASYGPFYSHGIIFYIFALLIAFKYLFQKKNVVNFIETSVLIFFSHFMVNVASYEKHLFYTAIFMLLLFIIRPTKASFILLSLFDLMVAINLIFFFGITGHTDIPRLFWGFDMTVLFAVFYVLIFIWVIKRYFQNKLFL